MELEKKLEAILFYKGEPVRLRDLAKALEATEEDISHSLQTLQTSLRERGIRLVIEGEYAGLATAPELRELIDSIRKDELEGPLGKAGLETLAIVIYRGPLSKAEIEYIRGVNCASILRSLTMRGLIEKVENPNDKRSFLYRGTPELPATLGLESLADAPDFASIKTELDRIVDAQKEELATDTNE